MIRSLKYFKRLSLETAILSYNEYDTYGEMALGVFVCAAIWI